MKKILTVIGTRPEAIKMAPLIISLSKNKLFNSKLCITGQHKEMLDQVLNLFQIQPDYDLNIMKKDQSLNNITSLIIEGMQPILEDFQPDLLLVHGDTASTFAASLSAFYKKIEIGHIEAGLRTNDLYSPWPEEANRKLTSVLANYHFAPTQYSKENLLSENIEEGKIHITGNTVIDCLLYTSPSPRD